jgi:hypothetical protein
MSDLKKLYGDEYPTAVVMDGVRLALHWECRFSRSYQSDDQKLGTIISRFVDGSASITASELQREWPIWTDYMRIDFCQSCGWGSLQEQADFPEMLRFIMQHGEQKQWSGIAMSVASQLPRDEAFDTLVRALRSTELGRSSDISQAIAYTKYPNAEATLRSHLATLWSHPSLWQDDDFRNRIGFEMTACIEFLIDLGAPPSDFIEQVRRLSEHVCLGNRDSCRNFLSRHYSWLK